MNLSAGVVEQQQYSSDEELVSACLQGDEEAWAAVIDKYKRLIFSIPVKYGFNRDDAADIFQTVCVDLVAELPHLREPRALPQWLIRTTTHRCFKHRRREQRYVTGAEEHIPMQVAVPRADALMSEVEREQALREAISALPPRCQSLIGMLFFESPARPYREVAAQLGLAVGSIGFVRGRCLERLRMAWERTNV